MTPAIRRLTGPLRRAWRVRGFGVHSPFAYAYLRSVIHPRRDARYYAEADMKSRRERLLYRIAVEAGAGGVTYISGSDSLIEPGARTYVARSTEAKTRLRAFAAQCGCGVVFASPSLTVYCRRPGIPYLYLEVSMP